MNVLFSSFKNELGLMETFSIIIIKDSEWNMWIMSLMNVSRKKNDKNRAKSEIIKINGLKINVKIFSLDLKITRAPIAPIIIFSNFNIEKTFFNIKNVPLSIKKKENSTNPLKKTQIKNKKNKKLNLIFFNRNKIGQTR